MDYRELNIKKGVIDEKQEQKVRILVIDRDVLVRQVIARIVRSHPSYNMVGSCSMVDSAEDMIRQLEPDVVLIDVDSLKNNGISEFAKIRKIYPLLPVILLGHRTSDDAHEIMNGLELGAFDYITKPNSMGMLLSAGNHFKKRVMPTIRAAVFGKKLHKSFNREIEVKNWPSNAIKNSDEEPYAANRIDVVVIGGCTGGPLALYSILSGLPAKFPVPVVLAQHMPKVYTKALVSKLAHKTKLKVREGYTGAVLGAGQIWVAPGGFHITIRREANQLKLNIHRGPRENTCRPSIDVLFRSVVDAYGSHVLAVVLSGRGIDGVAGCRYIKESGGQIIVQDRKSSIAWELPGTIVHNKLADCICSLDTLDKEIIDRVNKHRVRSVTID